MVVVSLNTKFYIFEDFLASKFYLLLGFLIVKRKKFDSYINSKL